MNGEVISAQIDIMEAGTTMINRYYPVNVKTGNTSTTYYKLGEDLTGKYNKDTYFIRYAAGKPARLVLQDECGRDSIPKGVGNTIR